MNRRTFLSGLTGIGLSTSALKGVLLAQQAPISLRSIRFKLTHGTATNQPLSIRRDLFRAVPDLEWEVGRDFTSEPSALAIAASEISGEVDINVEFQYADPASPAVMVRTILEQGSSPVLGTVAEAFAAPGFAIFKIRPAISGVGRHHVRWIWQWRSAASVEWTTFISTDHVVYTVLRPPSSPWTQPKNDSDVRDNVRLPWTDALDVACEWASGEQTEMGVLRRVEERVNGLDAIDLQWQGRRVNLFYDEAPELTDSRRNLFRLTSFLRLVGGTSDRFPTLNCSDCATAVSTLGNLLGCNAVQMRLDRQSNAECITLNAIRPLGLEPRLPDVSTDRASCSEPMFTFHEVAWLGAADDTGRVFDASLRLLGVIEPAGNTSWDLSGGLAFGAGDVPAPYRQRLAPAPFQAFGPTKQTRRDIFGAPPISPILSLTQKRDQRQRGALRRLDRAVSAAVTRLKWTLARDGRQPLQSPSGALTERILPDDSLHFTIKVPQQAERYEPTTFTVRAEPCLSQGADECLESFSQELDTPLIRLAASQRLGRFVGRTKSGRTLVMVAAQSLIVFRCALSGEQAMFVLARALYRELVPTR